MGWFKNILSGSPSKEAQLAVLKDIQDKFSVFRSLLEKHNQALKKISALEEKFQNRVELDIQSVRADLVEIQDDVGELIDKMVELGGDAYAPLKTRFASILNDIKSQFPQPNPVEKDDFIVPFDKLGKERAFSVGAKNANLGEMRSRIGLPVPDGFAISAYAHKHFIDVNQLQDKIAKLLAHVHIRRYRDLEIISDEIRELVIFRKVPEDLEVAIYAAYDKLAARNPGTKFALRSSAIGEDTSVTFAGQYVTFLNVGREALLEKYKAILASKFTPSAMYYLFSSAFSEMDLAMGVVCMELVDAASSGVVYTQDPINPAGNYVLINSIFGFGSYLVEGVLTPDIYHVSRDDKKILFSKIAKKPVKLALAENGVAETTVPESEREKPSLNEEQLRLLAEYALKIEAHYGAPQDVEWAMDKSGKIFLIQTRPLKIPKPIPAIPITDEMRSKVMFDGGVTICQGAGAGPAFHIYSLADLDKVPSGVALIAPNPSPAIVAVMHKIKALVTLVGGSASHMATIAREFSLPTISGIEKAANIPDNAPITVDATNGVIYDGVFSDWVAANKKSAETSEQFEPDETVKNVVHKIAHLNAIHPNDPNFTVENCATLHDVARFIHQKCMEVMFSSFKKTSLKEHIGLKLKTKIPLAINIIYLDREYLGNQSKKYVSENAVESDPMEYFWSGVLEEGWPTRPPSADLKGFLAVVGSNINEGHTPDFSENSYAFLSREYMLLSLRMGYHFQTIEGMATADVSKNYVRMQFKLGGASLDRRMRRIWLICEILRHMGFENYSQGDFLDSMMAYQTREGVLERMKSLGRVTILTKQLDMALTSDEVARWYASEFIAKLGLKGAGN